MNIKPFHQWKSEIVKEDSKNLRNATYFRWTKEKFYAKYGQYCQQMRDKNKIMKRKSR